MRKISQILTAAVFSVAFVGAGFLGSSAGAAPCNGNVSVSGNNSSVIVNCSDIQAVVINCVDNINIVTVNYQNGTSGSATVTGNASGGNASSGSVFNNNDSTVNASAACVTPVGSTNPTPSASPSPTPSTAPTKPVALPNTAGASAEVIVLSSLLAAAAVVIASRLAVAAYRRIGSK